MLLLPPGWNERWHHNKKQIEKENRQKSVIGKLKMTYIRGITTESQWDRDLWGTEWARMSAVGGERKQKRHFDERLVWLDHSCGHWEKLRERWGNWCIYNTAVVLRICVQIQALAQCFSTFFESKTPFVHNIIQRPCDISSCL